MTRKQITWCVSVLAIAACLTVSLTATDAAARGPRGEGPIIFVISQGLYYDSILGPELPRKGPFQLLQMDGPPPLGLQTEFGPGDRGYVGGRWWVDLDDDGEMGEDDGYFSCPLLGPGRETP